MRLTIKSDFNYEHCTICGVDTSIQNLYVDVNSDNYVCKHCAKENNLEVGKVEE